MQLIDLLKFAAQRKVSDVHIKAGATPMFRLAGQIYKANSPHITPELSQEMIYGILNDAQREEFEQTHELDFSYIIPEIARYRVNLYMQRSSVGACFRVIPLKIPSMEELTVPTILKSFCERPRGIVLVTGPAGAGKSTTQAAMIDYINSNFTHHIITVEDPVEFVHTNKKSVVNQREVHCDTRSFGNALKYSLREDPDIILVGEMRDLETISLAVTAAETGHLVIGTLHTTDAVSTVDRVIDVFPGHQQQQIRMQLSVGLVGIVSQLLVRKADGKGMVAAYEVLVGTYPVRALIREGKTPQLASSLQTGARDGMIMMEKSLAELVKAGAVTEEAALEQASHPGQVREHLRAN